MTKDCPEDIVVPPPCSCVVGGGAGAGGTPNVGGLCGGCGGLPVVVDPRASTFWMVGTLG